MGVGGGIVHCLFGIGGRVANRLLRVRSGVRHSFADSARALADLVARLVRVLETRQTPIANGTSTKNKTTHHADGEHTKK